MSSSEMSASRKLAISVQAAAFALLCFASASTVHGQAVAETAGANSVSASVASSIKPPTMPKFPGTGSGSGSSSAASSASSSSPHLIASAGPPAEETNLKSLQATAGKDAGKILLRATPVEAQIWVNGKIVGKTPLLLVVAPGKYQIEMRGSRGQTGKRSVDLLPRETRELAVKLDQLYPGRVAAAAH
jgi:PEGA domain